MRKYWLGILYCSTYFLVCLGFAGCQSRENTKLEQTAGNTMIQEKVAMSAKEQSNNSSVKGEENTGESIEKKQISLMEHDPEQFLYNNEDNSIEMIEKNGQKYDKYTLTDGEEWEKTASWKCKKGNQTMDKFVYVDKGTLYCFLKEYKKEKKKNNKVLVKQTLLKLKKDGTFKSVNLRKLGKKEVKDIEFSGTALALTMSDHSVKVYNIVEKSGLGAEHMRGEAGNNVFYKNHYFTKIDASSGECLLSDYDIRTGERIKSFVVGRDREHGQMRISHYQKELCLLTEEGLYLGQYTDMVLVHQCDISAMGDFSLSSVEYFQAARGNTLYYVWSEKNGNKHLVKGILKEKKKDSVSIVAKL